jgi:signal transduction histidine kinase
VLDIGIDAGLEWLLEKFIEQTGIPGTLRIGEPDLAVNDEYATAIFRIVQEALDNIVRHAQANAVEITLDRSGDDFILEVRDDGQGFDLNTPEEKTLGLVGIQERVRRLGGAVAIFSAPGKGTAIEVRMPVQPNLESV